MQGAHQRAPNFERIKEQPFGEIEPAHTHTHTQHTHTHMHTCTNTHDTHTHTNTHTHNTTQHNMWDCIVCYKTAHSRFPSHQRPPMAANAPDRPNLRGHSSDRARDGLESVSYVLWWFWMIWQVFAGVRVLKTIIIRIIGNGWSRKPGDICLSRRIFVLEI